MRGCAAAPMARIRFRKYSLLKSGGNTPTV
jgi:hypothetical protein